MSRWVGGWVEGVKSDIRRPHSPIALSPPQDPQLDSYVPVTKRNPLGLNATKQTWRSCFPPEYVDEMDEASALLDEWRAASSAFMDQIRANLAAWDALPDDTMVFCELCGGSHSVRMYH
jgi:hypothetical protein